jgi:hypothetical protein
VPEKQRVTEKRGTESGTPGGDSGFPEAVAAVMRLPLTDADKGRSHPTADAPRRIIAVSERAREMEHDTGATRMGRRSKARRELGLLPLR